ncbi:MAG TPA: class I SAM-dependent methyltransferase [Anaerolineae bacterium]|nr:class I SAM-dependent methyltransferase [Anaerolineae bacterium]
MTTWVEREARRIEKARTLLEPGISASGGTWADLGCGDGIFTVALHTLIRPGDEIYGVDTDQRALDALARHFAESYPDATLHPIRADFTRPLSLPPLAGSVMANALHFVREQPAVLARIRDLLKPGGRLIVVEYNTARGNAAVPYPLDESSFLQLAKSIGLREVRILAKIPSSFLGEMYAGMGLAGNGTRMNTDEH